MCSILFIIFDIFNRRNINKGLKWLSPRFLLSMPSRIPLKAGFLPAIVGNLLLLLTIAIITVPIGVGTAIYLEEYSNKKLHRIYSFLEINISEFSWSSSNSIWFIRVSYIF